MDRRLTTLLYSGLGNRMRVLLSSQIAAELTSRSFSYAWKRDHRFNCSPLSLWRLDSDRSSYFASLARSRQRIVAPSLDAIQACDDKHIFISTQQALQLPDNADTWQNRFAELQLAPPLEEQLSTLKRVVLPNTPYISMMVRAHPQAHTVTLSQSPLKWYVERLAEIRRTHPELPVYLSCDFKPAQDYLKAQFPQIFCLEKRGKYNTTVGVQEAVLDLYACAGSMHIIGPHWSSFLDMATALMGKDCSWETSSTQPLGERDLTRLIDSRG